MEKNKTRLEETNNMRGLMGLNVFTEDRSQEEIDANLKKAKNPGDGAEEESYDGHKFEKSVIGVDDDNIDEKSKEDEIYEDSEGEETYNYGELEGDDRKREDRLEDEERMAPKDRIGEIERHLDALKKDMAFDEDREDRDEEGTDFREQRTFKVKKNGKEFILSESEVKKILAVSKKKSLTETTVDDGSGQMNCIKGAIKAAGIEIPNSCKPKDGVPGGEIDIKECLQEGIKNLYRTNPLEAIEKVATLSAAITKCMKLTPIPSTGLLPEQIHTQKSMNPSDDTYESKEYPKFIKCFTRKTNLQEEDLPESCRTWFKRPSGSFEIQDQCQDDIAKENTSQRTKDWGRPYPSYNEIYKALSSCRFDIQK